MTGPESLVIDIEITVEVLTRRSQSLAAESKVRCPVTKNGAPGHRVPENWELPVNCVPADVGEAGEVAQRAEAEQQQSCGYGGN